MKSLMVKAEKIKPTLEIYDGALHMSFELKVSGCKAGEVLREFDSINFEPRRPDEDAKVLQAKLQKVVEFMDDLVAAENMRASLSGNGQLEVTRKLGVMANLLRTDDMVGD